MKVAVISCFADKNNYNRGNFIYEYFEKRNFNSYIIYSEFRHGSKKVIRENDKNWIPIETLAYTNNVSFKRLLSHIIFGIRAAKALKRLKPDIVYMAVPPNSVTYFAFKIARKLGSKIIIDIVDLWPESFPISNKLKKLLSPFLKVWMKFRDDKLKYADALMFECNLYKETIEKKNIINKNPHIIHLAKNKITNFNPDFSSCIDDTLNICYLGSINLLIDIQLIIRILRDVSRQRKVRMHIIGIGNKKDYFLSQLKQNNIDYIDYGAIYDESEKNKVMNYCDFGINLYRDNTMIGLTYKSVDYFSAALPIINSIKADTWSFVEYNGVGINCYRDNYQTTVERILNISNEEISEMKKQAFELYLNNFESSKVEVKIDKMLATIVPKEIL